jgi:hypothetical protein
MNYYHYLALENPNGVASILSEYGIKPSRNVNQLSKQLTQCVNRHGEDCLYKTTLIHPDRELMLDAFKVEIEKEKPKKEEVSNACGCSNFSNANANGQEIKKVVENIGFSNAIGDAQNKKTELLIVGGVVLIALALILNK